jgi:hypothetical protein
MKADVLPKWMQALWPLAYRNLEPILSRAALMSKGGRGWHVHIRR